MTAILVKEKLNLPNEFRIIEAFLVHNYGELMQSYRSWSPSKKPVLDELHGSYVNSMFKKYFTKCFEVATDHTHDYNFIVDCLEDEHLKREVHTVKHVEEVKETAKLSSSFSAKNETLPPKRQRKVSDLSNTRRRKSSNQLEELSSDPSQASFKERRRVRERSRPDRPKRETQPLQKPTVIKIDTEKAVMNAILSSDIRLQSGSFGRG